jgi:predicted ArsR family transcriptional regulator
VYTASVRRGIGRPSHLYALTSQAEALFPRCYERLLLDALDMIVERGGPEAIDLLFTQRRLALAQQYAPRLQGKHPAERMAELVTILNEQGYMCEWAQNPDGSLELIEYNCPIDCAARDHPQACEHELQLYQEVLGIPLTREETIAEGSNCCRYRSQT